MKSISIDYTLMVSPRWWTWRMVVWASKLAATYSKVDLHRLHSYIDCTLMVSTRGWIWRLRVASWVAEVLKEKEQRWPTNLETTVTKKCNTAGVAAAASCSPPFPWAPGRHSVVTL